MKPARTAAKPEGTRVGWADVLARWSLVEADLADAGYDLQDPGLVRAWPWWRDRIWSLLSADTRLRRALTPP
ncbi:hypothetical protein FA014_01890 [Cellulomonas hominis]|uniref:Uncharacterized protein n=1 Tax=Cellulomonas hominis TaxID=156981 RepID=A0A7Z8NR87_9CELL|nr:hypothetical protein FA014_01890 [Cellulomonas hominis]